MNHLKHKIVQAKHLFKALKNAKTKFAKAGVIKKLRKVVQKIHDAKNKIIAKANHTPKTKTHSNTKLPKL
jgi:2,4-dienoyl-CoA reductase-like NADH-dependent reductase (Old Yellow Enzyme family)